MTVLKRILGVHLLFAVILLTAITSCSQAEQPVTGTNIPAAVYDRQMAQQAGLRPVTEKYAVSPQIQIKDIKAIADAGFTRIINHRPDNEQKGQPLSADIAAEAQRLGLTFVNLPFSPGNLTEEVFDALSAELARSDEPTLAYCRSGTRAITIWALSEVRAGNQTPEQVIAAASAAGYNLQGQKEALEKLQTSDAD